MLKRLNDALPGLVGGILLYGALIWAGAIWFVSDRIFFTAGLAVGIVLAIGMAVHMAWVLFDVVNFTDAKKAGGRILAKSILRYVVVIGIFVWLYISGFGSLVAAFVGMLGLKIAAYLEPVVQRTFAKAGGESVDK